MNWENRTVSEDLRVDKYTVNEIFVNYLKDKFYVNRRYQRKLVWELKEKRLLIDSMLKKIPLPAILIAQYDLKEDNNFTVLEIVDGMQRLNTIISFVLGEFSILYKDKMCYFDPNSYNETFQLMMDGKLIPHESLLPRDICQEFCRYQLPAIITGQNKEIDELKIATGLEIPNATLLSWDELIAKIKEVQNSTVNENPISLGYVSHLTNKT